MDKRLTVAAYLVLALLFLAAVIAVYNTVLVLGGNVGNQPGREPDEVAEEMLVLLAKGTYADCLAALAKAEEVRKLPAPDSILDRVRAVEALAHALAWGELEGGEQHREKAELLVLKASMLGIDRALTAPAQALLELHSRNPVTARLIARQALGLGGWFKAIALHILGRSYIETGDYQRARDYLRQALQEPTPFQPAAAALEVLKTLDHRPQVE